MNKTLILVESPTKARTLDRFLKGKFDILASMGHVRDLPKGKFGVDVEHNFEPQYVIPKDKRKVVENLKEIVKNIDKIILATDPDREGEAIAYHLYEILKKEAKKGIKFERIAFHEITDKAINEALKNPREIDYHLVDAQTARRVLDRIVGYRLSPVLWKKIKRNLSAGRVQSVALRLIVEREKEVEKFTSEDYFKIVVFLSKKGSKAVDFNLSKINGEGIEITNKVKLYDGEYKYSKTSLDAKHAEEIVNNLKGRTFEVIDVTQKDTKRSAYPPFITSSLQQEGARRFGFSGKKTMSIAQKLYEEGYITYHRTDSFNLSNQFIIPVRTYIEKEFGKKYLSDSPRIYQTKSKNAQEAHEAIRPTSTDSKETIIAREHGSDFAKLYSLIYKRAVATQMADALFESTKVYVEARGSDVYLFERNGSVLKFDGFLKLWFREEDENMLPEYILSEKLNYEKANALDGKTTPPPRYTEASLIASLEKNGIGRPSTYASIVSTIEGRTYIERSEGKFIPTTIGIAVNKFLVGNFSDIDDIPFTAQMEDSLDEISNGKLDWVPMIKEFYGPFEEKVKLSENKDRIEIPLEKTGDKCPECGNDVVVRTSRFGKFLACSNFPECKYKESFKQETNAICPQDGGKILVRRTRKGRTFFGCANYPKCKFAVWKLKDLNNPQEPQASNSTNVSMDKSAGKQEQKKTRVVKKSKVKN